MGSGFTNSAGATIDVELFMAESPNDGASASSVFANNVVANSEIAVFMRRQVLLPTVPTNDWAVAPFPFDVPFVFSGQAHISWRANVYGNSNGNQIFTYPLDAWWNLGASTANGAAAGCRAQNATQASSHFASVFGPGSNSQFYGYSYITAGGTPAVMTIGSSGSSFNGIPLPFDLTPAGAPGCFIGNNILDVVTGVTQANPQGSVSLIVGIPADPGLTGGVFFTQFLFADFNANPLGLFTTNSQRNTIGTNVDMARIYAIGNPGGTGGTLHRQFGMAIGLN
jgi:hypothetical protein